MICLIVIFLDSILLFIICLNLLICLKIYSYKFLFIDFNYHLILISLFIFLLILPACFNNYSVLLTFISIILRQIFFLTNRLLLIFILLELSSLPMVFLITLFGRQPESITASFLLFYYSFIRSLPFILIFFNKIKMDNQLNNVRSILILLPFLVKLPTFGFHLWLPSAHVEAPTEGRIILAAIILKIGRFGLLRFYLFSWSFLLIISIFRCLICPIIATFQSDQKSLVAYRRVGHMGYVTLGLFLNINSSFASSWLIQIRHGFVSSLLFLLIGELAHINITRILYFNKHADFFNIIFAVFYNIGAPISLSFFSEIIIYSSISTISLFVGLFILIIIIWTTYFCIYLLTNTINNLNKTSIISFLHTTFLINLFLIF